MNHVEVRIHKIVPRSYVDGPGCRSVVFAQGCTLACPGCQNKHIWPAEGGTLVDTDDLADTLALLAGKSRAVTLSGGETFQQPAALESLLWELKVRRIHVIVYTGYTWEELHSHAGLALPLDINYFLENIDILVDGRYIRARDDPMLSWRGSRNQRVIDVQASLKAGHPVTLDWDNQLTLSPDGNIYLPAGLADAFSALGAPAPTRMCGQTRFGQTRGQL